MSKARVVPQHELEMRIAIARETARGPAPHVEKLSLRRRAAIIVGGAVLLWGIVAVIGFLLLRHH